MVIDGLFSSMGSDSHKFDNTPMPHLCSVAFPRESMEKNSVQMRLLERIV